MTDTTDPKLAQIMAEAHDAFADQPPLAQDPDAVKIDTYDSGFAAGLMRAARIAYGADAVDTIMEGWLAPKASAP